MNVHVLFEQYHIRTRPVWMMLLSWQCCYVEITDQSQEWCQALELCQVGAADAEMLPALLQSHSALGQGITFLCSVSITFTVIDILDMWLRLHYTHVYLDNLQEIGEELETKLIKCPQTLILAMGEDLRPGSLKWTSENGCWISRDSSRSLTEVSACRQPSDQCRPLILSVILSFPSHLSVGEIPWHFNINNNNMSQQQHFKTTIISGFPKTQTTEV